MNAGSGLTVNDRSAPKRLRGTPMIVPDTKTNRYFPRDVSHDSPESTDSKKAGLGVGGTRVYNYVKCLIRAQLKGMLDIDQQTRRSRSELILAKNVSDEIADVPYLFLALLGGAGRFTDTCLRAPVEVAGVYTPLPAAVRMPETFFWLSRGIKSTPLHDWQLRLQAATDRRRADAGSRPYMEGIPWSPTTGWNCNT